ncbi:hypothetical protein GCM10025794_27050 [Massilia kyonggiensis]
MELSLGVIAWSDKETAWNSPIPAAQDKKDSLTGANTPTK